MVQRDKESVPFLNSAAESLHSVLEEKNVFGKDEQNFDTLKAVGALLDDAVEGLYKDFNMIVLPDGVPKTTVLFSLMRQIEAKQETYKIVAPLAEAVRDAIDVVNKKYKEQ